MNQNELQTQACSFQELAIAYAPALFSGIGCKHTLSLDSGV